MQSKISFFTHSHRFFLKDKNNKSQQQTQNGDKKLRNKSWAIKE